MLKDKRIIKFILRLFAITLFGLWVIAISHILYILFHRKNIASFQSAAVSQILSYPNPLTVTTPTNYPIHLIEESQVHIFIYDTLVI